MNSTHLIHSVGPFTLGKTLGEGATGKVKLGRHNVTGQQVAIKIVSKDFLHKSPNMRKKVEREIVIMKLMNHPHVLHLYDVYETSEYLFLILEHVEGGELFDYLVKRGTLSAADAMHFFAQILDGLEYCHAHLICHRDLKPENLLLDADNNIRIADWGMASLMKEGSLLQTSCGSPHYASPEVIMGKKYDGRAADVWSLGVILYALSTGKLPFDDDNIRNLLSKVKSGVFSMPTYLDSSLKDLLWKMLTVDPKKRITIPEIKSHPCYLTYVQGNDNKASLVGDYNLTSHVEQKMAEPIRDFPLDEDIMKSLHALGFSEDQQALQLTLSSPYPSIQKVFYRLLKERKARLAKAAKEGKETAFWRLDDEESDSDEDSKEDEEEDEEHDEEEEGEELMDTEGAATRTITRPVHIKAKLHPPTTVPAGFSGSPIVGSSPKKTWLAQVFGSYAASPSFTNGSLKGSKGEASGAKICVVSLGQDYALSKVTSELTAALNRLGVRFEEQEVEDGKSLFALQAQYDAFDAPSTVCFRVTVQGRQEGFADVASSLVFQRLSGDQLSFQTICKRCKREMHL
ncbi:Serine/threonine-protein kinase brsk1 [Balamuthia mandrillaris]